MINFKPSLAVSIALLIPLQEMNNADNIFSFSFFFRIMFSILLYTTDNKIPIINTSNIQHLYLFMHLNLTSHFFFLSEYLISIRPTATMANYTARLIETLHQMQKDNQLCDITINVSGSSFHAHKAVLAAASNYFMTMFTSDFKERNETNICIEGDPQIFECLLNFAYTGNVKCTLETAADLLELANYMQFTDAIEPISLQTIAAIQTASPKESIDSVCQVHEVATTHNLHLEKEAIKYMCNNFQDLQTSEAFLQASFNTVKSILQQTNLAKEDEEKQVSSILTITTSQLQHLLVKGTT